MKNKTQKSSIKRLKVSKRTSSYVHENLSTIQELLALGYTHDNYNSVSRCLNKISGHLFLEDIAAIGELWRDTFTDNSEQAVVTSVLEEIKSRF